MIILTIEDVIAIHDEILSNERGSKGYYGDDRLGGAIGRVCNHVDYDGMDDLFEIAALYIEVISKGHCFVDANKRTALMAASTFLELHDVSLKTNKDLAYVVESFVKNEIDRNDMADILRYLSIY